MLSNMLALFVIHMSVWELIVLSLLGLGALWFGGYVTYLWVKSPNRWWNKRG